MKNTVLIFFEIVAEFDFDICRAIQGWLQGWVQAFDLWPPTPEIIREYM